MYGKLKINCTLYSTTMMLKFGEGSLLDALYVNFAIHKLLRVQFNKLLFVIRLPAALAINLLNRQGEFQNRDEASSINICSQTAKGKLFNHFNNEVETS